MTNNKENTNICMHCGKYAVVSNPPLCVEHWLIFEQAKHLQLSWLASQHNRVASELEADSGVPMSRMEIPFIPFIGKNYTINHINVREGHINIKAKTIQNIDITIGKIINQGNKELADEIQRLTEAINDSQELTREIQDEVAEQLAFLVAQVTINKEDRSKGIIKSIMHGMNTTLGTSAALLTIWNNIEPLLRSALGG